MFRYRRLYRDQKEKLAAVRKVRKKLQGNEMEKKQLYDMLECQMCNTEFKNVMLPCSHMFCHDCITKQIKSRNRKCPACNQRFDQDSIRKFVFNS